MGDKPITVRFDANAKPDEIGRQIEAARARGLRETLPPEHGKAGAAIDQLVSTSPDKKDTSKGRVERANVTPSEAREGITDSIVLHYPAKAGQKQDTQLKLGLDREGHLAKIGAVGEAAKVADSYVRKDGIWHWKDKQGKLQPMPKSLQTYEFSPQTGEFQSQDRADHISVYKLDGSKSDINILPTGARVRTDDKGAIEQVARTDSTVLVPKYKTDADGNKTAELDGFSISKPDRNKSLATQVSYHREGKDFVPDEGFKDKPTLTDVALAASGSLSYKHKDGASAGQEFTESGTGVALGGKTGYKFDALGRITSVTPCAEDLKTGGFIRAGIQYRGNSNDIVAYTVHSPNNQDDLKYHAKFDEGEHKWKLTDDKGRDYAIGQQNPFFNRNGEFATTSTIGRAGAKEEVERVIHANGSVTRESAVDLPDGSRATRIYDAAGIMTSTKVEKDGKLVCSISLDKEQGQARIVRTDSTSDKPTVWRQSPGRDATWTSDQPLAPQLRAMSFDGNGVLSYLDADGARHRLMADSTESINYQDNTFAQKDGKGNFVKTGVDKDHYLDYVRDEAGKLLKVERHYPEHNGELWNAASKLAGEVLADGTFRRTDAEGRRVEELRDLRSNLYERDPSKDGVTLLLSQVTLPTGEKCAFKYGADRDLQHPEKITFTHTERRRGQDGQVTTVFTALPTNVADPGSIDTPGQRVAPMQLYSRTSAIRFDQPPFDPYVEDRSRNMPSTYFGLAVRPNGDLEATSYDRAAGRYIFHGDRMGRNNHVTQLKADAQRFIAAKKEFDDVFDNQVAPLLNQAQQNGHDLLARQTRTETKQRFVRNLYLNHITGQERPLLADLEDSRLPGQGLPRRDYKTKAKELEAARAMVEEALRRRRAELGT